MRAPFLIVDDFLPIEFATAMRGDIESHFSNPAEHRREVHQIWNYWFVPGLYTYLRTTPERVLQRAHVERFMQTLTDWAMQKLGMRNVTWPYLSMYVSGCRQGLHNDSHNGRFAFVYSLTKAERRTTGGETLVVHEGDLFRSLVRTAAAGGGLYTAIEPAFNRLVVFDDRLPHAVERVDGSMDPLEGRFVLHGHVGEGGAIVQGALAAESVAAQVMNAMLEFAAENMARMRVYHGPLVVRFSIEAGGSVERSEVIVDRVTRADANDIEWQPVVASLLAKLGRLKFPPAAGATTVTQPLLFGAA
jgi:2OG-Fe(II) oxygenase superfamily